MKNPVDNDFPNSIAAIWSMMLPGLGQLQKRQAMAGVVWAFLTAGGYFAYFWPGLIIHGFCIADAAFNKGVKPWKTLLLIVPLLLIYIILRNSY